MDLHPLSQKAPARFTALMILVLQEDKILLGKRENTGFMDGWYALPGGRHEANESLKEGVAREAFEELGIMCNTEDIHYSSVIHFCDKKEEKEILYVSFVITKFQNILCNNEPHKCSEIRFFNLHQLPENTTLISRLCIQNHLQGVTYLEMGWEGTYQALPETAFSSTDC